MKNIYLFIPIFIFIMLIVNAMLLDNNKSPEKVIENLYDAIHAAEQRGDYDCCIEPACTMCYLGHWKFDLGTCHCDEAIAEGRNEDVCPECKSGMEKGLCESSEIKVGDCVLDEEVYGGYANTKKLLG